MGVLHYVMQKVVLPVPAFPVRNNGLFVWLIHFDASSTKLSGAVSILKGKKDLIKLVVHTYWDTKTIKIPQQNN